MAATLAALPPEERPPSPDVRPDLAWVWRAWWRLHRDRPWFGGGLGRAAPGSIPFRDVVQWCQANGHPRKVWGFVDRCFQAMDREFLAHHTRQAAPADG